MEQIQKKIFINGTIEVLSGLHIGGTDNVLEIGGVSNPIIRIKRGKKNRPYIPGSSLKGKMRSLIEHFRGDYSKANGELMSAQEEQYPTARIFGTAAGDGNDDENTFNRPSRIIIRDAYLEDDENALDPTEVKTENNVSRITAKATPRSFERVLPGSKFEFEFILSIFTSDFDDKEDNKRQDSFENDAQRMLGYMFVGMNFLEEDFLGGSGTRGSGAIKFNVKSIAQRTSEDYQNLKDRSVLENVPVRPKDMEEFHKLADKLKLNSSE